MSVVWWRSLHQEATVIRPGAPTMDTSMLIALLVGTVAFSVAYGYLMAVRLRIGRLEDHAAATVMSQPSPRARAPRPAATVAQPVGGEPRG
jgi:heme exporter protein C